MPYVFTKEYFPLAGCNSCGGGGFGSFGASAPRSDAVLKLQQALKDYAAQSDNVDYDPGPLDGQYGKNTHAAVIRLGVALLGWTAGPGCQSQCNTLRTEVKSVCADCIEGALPEMATKLGSVSFDSGEVRAIVAAYRAFLDAYIAEYGEGGELDPAQIARREGVDLEEAERLAAARRAEEEAARLAAAEAARLAAEEEAARRAAAGGAGPGIQRAGFSGWWWVVLFVGLGGGLMYAAYKDKQKQEGAPGEKKALPAAAKRGRMDYSGRRGW